MDRSTLVARPGPHRQRPTNHGRTAIDAICARTHGSLTEQVWQLYAGGTPYRAPCPPTSAAGPVAAGPTTAAPSDRGTTRPSASDAPTTAAAAAPCVQANLNLEYGTPATARDMVRLVITNTGSGPCRLDNLPVIFVAWPDDTSPTPPGGELRRLNTQPTPVVVAPGGKAHVDIMFTGPPDGERPNAIPRTISLVLPYGGGTLTLPWTLGEAVDTYQSSSHPPTFSSAFVSGP